MLFKIVAQLTKLLKKSMENNYLYGLTVQGIQSYIFSTNKLKEIIGASEIIEKLCTKWFFDFLKVDKKEKGIYHLNAAGNIRFQTDKTTAQRIFKEFHFELLKKAPGVPFSQAVIEIEDNKEYEAIQKLDRALRGQRNQPLFNSDLGVMVRQKYRPTGNFACLKNTKVKDDNKNVDVVTSAKYDHSDATSLTGKIKIDSPTLKYPTEFSEIAKGSKHSWLAVIHIDGNGMGNIIKSILKGDNKNNKEKKGKKFEKLQEFSIDVGKCTLKAFITAIKEVVLPYGIKGDDSELTLPIRPLIIGGDDVTTIIRADLALEFTRVYLKAFEKETKEAELHNKSKITACAGIAYVKEKFPFHYSAHLAEELCVYAKNKSDRKASCVQFHKVQDSIIDGYKEITARELSTSNQNFVNGPYYLDKYVDKNHISTLTKEVFSLKDENSPKNGMREYIDASFNNPAMATILMSRMQEKYKKYKKLLDRKEAYIDFHTLLSIDTKTE